MSKIWGRIAQTLGRRASGPGFRVAPETVAPLLRSLQATMERELGCAESDVLMDSFAEALAAGASAESLAAEFRNHLSLCPDCREEFEALIRVLAAAGG